MDAKVQCLFVELSRCFNPRARDGRERILLVYERRPNSFNPRARDGREDCS